MLAHLIRISAFTIVQAVCSTVIALAVGIPAAFWTSHRHFFGRRFLLSLSSVPMCIPTLIIALAYVSFFGMAGVVNTAAKALLHTKTPPITFLYSFWGIIIAQGFYNFPLVMAHVHDAWSHLPQEQAEAARLLGAREGRIFRTITLFQLLPSIVSSCMLVFLYCFFSFMIILLFGGIGTATLEVEIYQSARASLNTAQTAYLSIVETAIACLFVALYSLLEQKAAQNRGLAFAEEHARTHIRGVKEIAGFVVTGTLIVLFFLSPLATIVGNACSSAKEAFSLVTFKRLFAMRGFGRACATTIITASATAFFSVTVAFFYAACLRSVDPDGKRLILRIIPMLPMAVSSVVTGVVLTMLVKRGTGALLVFAQVALTWPLAFRHIYATLAKVPEETLDAARLLSHKKRHLLVRMYLPLCARSLVSAAGFCFAVSAGDTSLPLVLALPRFDTLALFTYRLAGSYRFHEACAAGLMLAILCGTVFALAHRLRKGER